MMGQLMKPKKTEITGKVHTCTSHSAGCKVCLFNRTVMDTFVTICCFFFSDKLRKEINKVSKKI